MIIKKDRDEILWEVTRSLCPTCKSVVDAQVLLRGGKVFMRKRCPQHGQFEALIFGDAKLYVDIQRFNKPGTLPQHFTAEVRNGCPLDCGMCPDHQQHACLGLIEVNNLCNLDCPLCFADAGSRRNHAGGFELTREQVSFMLDAYVAAEGAPEVLQFSGGEPTLHPDILLFIAQAQARGIKHVMLNTNGIRIANDAPFVEELARLRPVIYLQFDGFEPATHLAIRGREDLLEVKLRALDRLAQAGLSVVLVPAIERDINVHEIGRILDFGLRHPAVLGINFQCAFRAQRHIPADPLTRVTVPDVVQAIESQLNGLIKLQDFVPVPCCMPVCSFVTYVMLQDDDIIPIPRILPVESYLDYLKNRTLPGLDEELLVALERLWSASAQVGSDNMALDLGLALNAAPQEASRASERCPSCTAHLPIRAHAPRDLGRHVFTVSIRDFMDPWTFHVKNAMKCCVNFITPDGRLIPFCSYNSVGYREAITAQLVSGG